MNYQLGDTNLEMQANVVAGEMNCIVSKIYRALTSPESRVPSLELRFPS